MATHCWSSKQIFTSNLVSNVGYSSAPCDYHLKVFLSKAYVWRYPPPPARAKLYTISGSLLGQNVYPEIRIKTIFRGSQEHGSQIFLCIHSLPLPTSLQHIQF